MSQMRFVLSPFHPSEFPMRLFTIAALCLAAFLASANLAQAGPIRDRLKARFGGNHCGASTCSAAPAIAQPTTGVHAAQPITLTAPGSSNCPDGKCPPPAMERRGFGVFRR